MGPRPPPGRSNLQLAHRPGPRRPERPAYGHPCHHGRNDRGGRARGTGQRGQTLRFSLLSKRKGFYERDYASAGTIQGGYLYLRGLAPGDYELFLKRTRQTITLRITEGKRANGFVLSKNRIPKTTGSTPSKSKPLPSRTEVRRSSLETRASSPASTSMPPGTSRIGIPFPPWAVGGAPSPYSMNLASKRSLCVKERAIGENTATCSTAGMPSSTGQHARAPALILNPWSVRKTDTGRQNAALGGDYERKMDQTGESKSGRRDYALPQAEGKATMPTWTSSSKMPFSGQT